MAHPEFQVFLRSGEVDCKPLHLASVEGVEHISRPFRFEIVAVALEGATLDTDKATGASAALIFFERGEEVRRIHGMIVEVTDLLDTTADHTTYRIALVPRASRLLLRRTQRVFIDTSIPEILKKQLDDVGLHDEDVEMRLSGLYGKREFVVQYGETDLALVSRWTEHLGISFFFEHDEERDRIVFSDHQDAFQSVPHAERVQFRTVAPMRHGVFRLERTTRVVPSTFILDDYNYEKPLLDLRSTAKVEGGYGGGVVEYGANFQTPEQGLAFAKVRAQERFVDAETYDGESGILTLTAGARFALDEHPRLSGLELLVVEVKHTLRQPVAMRAPSDTELRYSNTFRAIDANVTYRPPRVTPRPRIFGVTSGIVESAPGVDVTHAYMDEHGRYLVRILFDTAASGTRKASLPIRMAQAHSGPNYGIHFPLRPGTEVLLSFVDGDPDRPLIVGSVPNAVTPSPVVNAEPTVSRIRTASGVLVEIDDGR